MFRALQIAGLALAGIGALGGGVWVLGWSDLVRYRELRVVGSDHLTEVQARHLSDIPVGTPLVAVDLDAVVAGIARHPWVASAEARRVFPDTVVVQVHERVPRAVLVLDGLYLVDADGVPFLRAVGPDLDRVLLTGLSPDLAQQEPAVARRILQEGLALLDAAVATGELRESEISEVRFGTRSGYTLALRNGGEILLGFRGTTALARLSRLVAAGVDLAQPHRVDLGLDHHAVVTPS